MIYDSVLLPFISLPFLTGMSAICAYIQFSSTLYAAGVVAGHTLTKKEEEIKNNKACAIWKIQFKKI